MSNRIVIVGGGGRAKVIASILHSQGHKLLTVVDDDPELQGREIGGVIVGDLASLKLGPQAQGILAIDDNKRRRRMARELGLRWISVIHPSAVVDGTVGDGAVIDAGAVVQAGAVIGEHAILGAGVIVAHDARVGAFVHVASGATLADHVEAQEGAFLGIGCSVLPGIKIGAWSTIGAGSVVKKDIAAICLDLPSTAENYYKIESCTSE